MGRWNFATFELTPYPDENEEFSANFISTMNSSSKFLWFNLNEIMITIIAYIWIVSRNIYGPKTIGAQALTKNKYIASNIATIH